MNRLYIKYVCDYQHGIGKSIEYLLTGGFVQINLTQFLLKVL